MGHSREPETVENSQAIAEFEPQHVVEVPVDVGGNSKELPAFQQSNVYGVDETQTGLGDTHLIQILPVFDLLIQVAFDPKILCGNPSVRTRWGFRLNLVFLWYEK
jgi:hypothetical protein